MDRERLNGAIVPALVFVLGLLTIGGAWVSQVFFGYIPCKLCLEQRIPYYVGLPIVLLAIVALAAGAPPRVSRVLMGVAALIFAVNIYLATYHAGVEWGWWAGPADCGTGGGGQATTTQDLLNQLKGIHIVSCTQAAFRFLGLSFAGWNAVISVVLTAGAAFAALGLALPKFVRSLSGGAYGSSSVSQ
jgi:disulfide bond formation protein DsbB